MLTFNQRPPTAETTDVDPAAIRFLAYGIEDRSINGVAEVCASIVLANVRDDMAEVLAIGEKIGEAIKASPDSKYPEDGVSFILRYGEAVTALSARVVRI